MQLSLHCTSKKVSCVAKGHTSTRSPIDFTPSALVSQNVLYYSSYNYTCSELKRTCVDRCTWINYGASNFLKRRPEWKDSQQRNSKLLGLSLALLTMVVAECSICSKSRSQCCTGKSELPRPNIAVALQMQQLKTLSVKPCL